MRFKRLVAGGILAMSLSGISITNVMAEEITLIDGSALTYETSAEDTETLLARGNILSNGVMQITNKGNRTVLVAGTTTCHVTCDKVVCNLYLEQLSSSGTWNSYKYWNCSTTNAYTYSPTKTTSVVGGHWYRATGGHIATKGSTVESVNTKTDGIWIG